MLQDMMNINFFSFVDVTCELITALTESKGSIGVVSSIVVTIIVYGPVLPETAVEMAKVQNPILDMKSIGESCENAADVLVGGVSARKY
ncbi:hypothetical protein CHUAL_002609 [Chamberlinius hualienensis]